MMTDALSTLIAQEIARQVKANTVKIAYGVWIPGLGWLRHEPTKRVFAALQIEVAESAAALWGPDARVMAFDESLADLETVFLEREPVNAQGKPRDWKMRLYGVFGHN